jgi:exodeoxyribonuclease VII small subunit
MHRIEGAQTEREVCLILLYLSSFFQRFTAFTPPASRHSSAPADAMRDAADLTRSLRMRYVSSFSHPSPQSPHMADKPKAEPKNFEAAMAELESIVERMEDGQLPLEESLSAYQRGFALLKYCEKILGDAQQRIRVLEEGKLKDFPSDKS